MPTVVLNGWDPGLRKISLTTLFQTGAGRGLAEAKGMTDSLLDGRRIEIQFESAAAAATFLQQAKALGVHAEVSDV